MSKITKKIIIISLIIFSFFNCQNKNLNELKKLDNKVRHLEKLYQFGSFKKSKKKINNVEVCSSKIVECRPNEQEYSKILEKINIPVSEFDELIKKMDKLGYKTYYKYKDYSLWVENGSLGHIYGHLINHNPSLLEIKPFNLNDKHLIGVGNEVQENIYYFSSN